MEEEARNLPSRLVGDLEVSAESSVPESTRREPAKSVDFQEDDRIRLRRTTPNELLGLGYDWLFAELDDRDNELDAVWRGSAQELSDLLCDQFEFPRFLGPHSGSDAWWLYKGRYFVVAPKTSPVDLGNAIGEIAAANEDDVKAFIEENLPQARTMLERYILWAHEGDSSFDDVVDHIEIELLVAEDAEKDDVRARMRAVVERARDHGQMSASDLARCFAALGESVAGREAIPEHVRHAVWRRDQGRCTSCGSQEKLEFDHIIPFSKGGSNTERNLQLLCETCNRAKSAHI